MTGVRRALERRTGEEGMTLVELLVTSTVLLILMGMVLVSITMVETLSNSITSQYQEFQQAVPAMAPFHGLVAAQIEPAPPVGGVPTPPFAAIGNFSATFYSNIGTAYGNTTSCPSGQSCATGGTTAGPAKIVGIELAPDGVSPATACSPAAPCSFQLRMYLPIVGLSAPGVSSCPDVGTGPTCQYSTDYRLLANVQYVVNDPSSLGSAGDMPIFSYNIFDPGGSFPPLTPPTTSPPTYPSLNIPLTWTEVQNQSITGLPAPYPNSTQALMACAAPSAAYPTPGTACPADNIQSVNVDLQIARPGTGANGTQENSLVVYRYAPSPGSTTAPYQYSTAVG